MTPVGRIAKDTTAQAVRLGIPRDALAYAARSGRIERIAQGAYRLAATANDGLDELRAVWKLTAPSTFSYERSKAEGWDGIAVCGLTASYILGIGDFYVSLYHIAASRRLNSRRRNVHFVRADVAREDVVWLDGLPVTRLEVTIAMLVRLGEDPSLVADAFADAVRTYGSTSIDIRRAKALLGERAFEQVLEDAGIGSKGPRRLMCLDELGHVAIVEGMGRYKTARALEMAVKEAARKSPMDTNAAIEGFYFHRLWN